MPRSRTLLTLSFVLGVFAARAAAQPSDKATAEVLFTRGVQLLEAGQYTEACHMFEQSEEVDHGIGTLLYLAECYERSGRTASAWAEFRRAASLASAAGQVERARSATERADRLERTLSTLAIAIDAPAPDERVERDGTEVPATAWALPVPVDPGEHVLAARAPGHTSWSARVYVGAGGAAVHQTIPALLPVAPVVSAPLAAPVLPAPLVPVGETAPRRRAWLWAAAGAVVAGAVLAAGLLWRQGHERAEPGYAGSTGDRVPAP